MIVFVQPFSLYSPGGGARILRSLVQDAPEPFVSVCTDLTPPASGPSEISLPLRPHFGRIERTRFGPALGRLLPFYHARFVEQLIALCRREQATAVHAVAHGLDFWGAFQAAQTLHLPFFLSVHDDLLYALRGRPERRLGAAVIGEVWRQAAGRTVISDAMGREYCRRYGERPFAVITDGLGTIPARPLVRPGSLRVYFMGLFHLSYEENLAALLAALSLLRAECPAMRISLTCRCGSLPLRLLGPANPVTVLPFGTEAEVAEDMESADLLYFPLPFGKEYEAFVRYSVSTKMVTYLGSGLPILYHGPADTAAGGMLASAGAALVAGTLVPEQIAHTLAVSSEAGPAAAENALTLARTSFQASGIKARFWSLLRQGRSQAETLQAETQQGVRAGSEAA